MLQKLYRKLRRDARLRAVAIAGLSTLVLWILLLGAPFFSNASKPRILGNSQLAMQFVADAQDVELILGESPSPDREVMRFKIYLDFFFIASYVWLFVALGKWVGSCPLIACGVLAGVFDVAENFAILRVVNTPLQLTTQGMVDAIRYASMAKWGLVAVALVVYSRRRMKMTN
jgi:hypothetical protein